MTQKSPKKFFCEDIHIIYHFVPNFKEIKNNIGSYVIISSVRELQSMICWSIQGQVINIRSVS